MPRDAVDNSASAGVQFDEFQRFYTDLANGLHAMAQPLTILRSALEILTLPREAPIDQRHYLEISAKQVQRTCGLFSDLQDLVTARLIDAERSRLDLWQLVTPILEDQRTALLASGVAIAVARHHELKPVYGDAGRTEQAITAALRAAASFSARGDVIELLSSDARGYVEFTVQNTRRHGMRMNSSDRLSLSVAEINILSQHGRYQFVEDPFCVSLALPVEDLGPVKSAVPSVHRQQYH